GAAAALLLLLAAAAAPAGTTLVTETAATEGSAPDIVTAYGTVMAAQDHGLTLSAQQDGRVVSLAVTPGEAVTAGQALVTLAPTPAAASAYRQAETAVALARRERAHAAQLLTQQLATRDQLAQADKALSDAEAALAALQDAGAGVAQRVLSAPFDAIVTAIPVAPGDHVPPGAGLLTLAPRGGLVVTVGIEPAARARVRAGQTGVLTPLAGGATLHGEVLRVDAQVDARTHLVDVDIVLGAGTAGGGLLMGAAYEAAITVGVVHGWVLPHAAVLLDDSGTYVYQDADGTASRVDVRLLGRAGDHDVVAGRLDAGRPVVVDGAYQLTPGARLRQSEAAAGPDARR
ncbi:efflux RND transporter periplasmic adaptor subunit, partial [Acidisphaera rubrifaciens]|uniref:efflux RND transporter periplasmic adaptor subunit n=1 Tax=Acidisphaera rubrifaciens TaxID=50715 RepID=UPI000699339F